MVPKLAMIFRVLILLGLLTSIQTKSYNETTDFQSDTFSLMFVKKTFGKLLTFHFEVSNIMKPYPKTCRSKNTMWYCCVNITAEDQDHVPKTGCISFQPHQGAVMLKVMNKAGSVFLHPEAGSPNEYLEFRVDQSEQYMYFNFEVVKTPPNGPPQICRYADRAYNCCFSFTVPVLRMNKKGGCLSFDYPPKEGKEINFTMHWEGGYFNGNPESGIEYEVVEVDAAQLDVDDSKVQTNNTPYGDFWTKSKPCSCKNGACKCCAETLKPLPYHLPNRACTYLIFWGGSLYMEVSANNNVLYGDMVSGDNSEPVCVTSSLTSLERVCVEFKNAYRVGDIVHGCVEIKGMFNKSPLFHEALGCLRLGPNGLAETVDDLYQTSSTVKGTN